MPCGTPRRATINTIGFSEANAPGEDFLFSLEHEYDEQCRGARRSHPRRCCLYVLEWIPLQVFSVVGIGVMAVDAAKGLGEVANVMALRVTDAGTGLGVVVQLHPRGTGSEIGPSESRNELLGQRAARIARPRQQTDIRNGSMAPWEQTA